MIRKLQYNSPVILSFTLAALLVLMLDQLTAGVSNKLLFSIKRSSPLDPLEYIRLFGHVLGHKDWVHFYSNFVIILLVGPMLEEKYGSKNLLIMIGFTALVTGLLNILFFDTRLLGASGVAFMLILLSSFVNIEKGRIPVTLIVIVCMFIGREVFTGIFSNDNISQMAHIVGGICGGIFGYTIDKAKK